MSMTDNRNWRDQNTRSNNNQGNHPNNQNGQHGGQGNGGWNNRPNNQNGQRGGQGNGGWNNRPNNQNHHSNGQGYGHNANHSNQHSHRPGGQGNGNGNRQSNNTRNQGNDPQDRLNLQGTNLGYLFNRLLYTDETGLRENRGDANNNLIKNRLSQLYKDSRIQLERAQALLAPPEGLVTDTIELETQYPGLCVGLGYTHGLSVNDDIKNGFFFDHTSGLPIIPASSVKGKLRSAFEEMPEYTLLLLQETEFFANADEATVKALLNELFEGEGEKQQPLPMNQRTVFFDAYPCQCSNQGLLGPDSITPHDEKGLKEPNPIKILKVKGGVRWRFPFRFATMEEGRKKALVQVFTQLLMDWGIGAKTNVGYGTLIRCRT